MKRIFTLCMLACICLAASAQNERPQGGKELTPEQREQKREQHAAQSESEKIAFITKTVDILPEEAGAFWALYNKLEKDQKELVAAEKEAFKALNIALMAKNEDGTPSTPEATVDNLLKSYLAAKKANTDVHAAHIGDYKKIISTRKTALFFAAQERFRLQQIKKLSNPGHGQGGNRNQGGYGAPKH